MLRSAVCVRSWDQYTYNWGLHADWVHAVWGQRFTLKQKEQYMFVLSMRFREVSQFKHVAISFHDDIKDNRCVKLLNEGDNLPRRDHSAPS